MINYWKLINTIFLYIYICMHKLKHFQPHSFLCHLWCILFANCSFSCEILIYLYMMTSKVDEAASTNFFFIIYFFFHIANQLFQHSCTSQTIASSQHHPRETRPLMGEPNLYKNCYIGMLYDELASYIEKVEVNLFAYKFFFIQLFHFLFLSLHY